MKKMIAFAAFALLISTLATAQTDTGLQPFGSFGGGPFDVVNLGPLNVHFEVPITSKAGRVVPFFYKISYDSLIWTPANGNGSSTWSPQANLGWQAQTDAFVGYVTYTQNNNGPCPTPGDRSISRTNYGYHDSRGGGHAFPNIFVYISDCNGFTSASSQTTTDGSGITLSVDGSTPDIATVTTRDGARSTVGRFPYSSASLKNTNGNFISTDGTTFTDTLGATALTLSGSGTPSSPFVYSFPNSSGGTSTVTTHYTSYTIQTNFQCSGISEYSASGVNLPTSIVLPDLSQYQFTYEQTPGSGPGFTTGRIASVTLPTGGTITYTYTGSNNGINCTDGSTMGLTRALGGNIDAGGTWTYTRSFNSSSNLWQTTISDPVTPVSNQTVLNFATVGGFYFETSRNAYQGSAVPANLLLSVTHCWNGTCTPGVSAPISQVDIYTQPAGAPSAAHQETLYNSNGLPASISEWDYGTSVASRVTTISYASPGNGIVDRPSDIKVTDGAGNRLSETQISYDESALASTSGVPNHDYTIYNSSFTQRGNPTTVKQWVSGTTFLSTTNTYDDLGNLRTTTDPGGHQTTFDYTDSYNDGLNHSTQAFATTITMPTTTGNGTNVAHVLKNKYYWPSTMLYQAIDQNNQSTTYSYDNMWRTTEIDFPDGGETTFTYTAFTSGSFASLETNNKVDTAGNWAHSFQEFDGFGRIDRTAFYNTTNFDQVDTCYNASGQVSKVSYGYIGQGWSGHPKDCTVPGDSFAYDGLGRQRAVMHSDGTAVTTSYNGRAVQVQDEGNGSGTQVTHVYQADGLGRTTTVCEVAASIFGISTMPTCGLDLAGNSNGVTTSYTYDALNRIKTVSQGSLNQRQLAYDGLSHVIGEVIPEVNNNACTGSDNNHYSVCFNYDSEGKLISRVRPRPNQAVGGTAVTTTNYSYDELHRLRIANYDDTSTENTPAQVFFYDPTGGIGQLASAISENHALNTGYTFDNLSYDVMGRPTSDQQTVAVPSSIQQTFSYGYNLLGEVTTANFSNFSLTNSYNSAARLTQIQSSLNDANHPPTLLSSLQYNQFGQVTSDSLGNGVNESFGYDLRGRLLSASAVKGASTLYSLGGPGMGNVMTYAPNSGLTAVNDSVNGNWMYSYDALNRIAGANKSGGTNFTFDIDRNSNRWHQNPSGQGAQLSFDNTTNHVASGNGVTYDAVGNIINDGNCAYTYDGEYRITTVSGGTCTTASYLYDAFGRRAQRIVGSNTYDELYDLGGNVVVELTPGGTTTGYEVFHGGRHLATYANNSTYFLHTDWLGTERVRTDPSGNVAVSCTSNPYGDNQVCTGSDQSRIHYAGMEYDSESQLYHTFFRYYNPRLGLWMTPDPAGMGAASLGDPQSLNRFAYVGNSPINSVDPLGMSAVKLAEPAPTGPQINPFDLVNAYFNWYNGLFIPGSNGFPAKISDYDFNAIDSALASILAASNGGWSLDSGGGALSGETLGLPSGMRVPPLNLGDVIGGVLGIPNSNPLCDFVPNCGNQPSFGFSSPAVPWGRIAVGGILEGICWVVEPCGVVQAIGIVVGSVLVLSTTGDNSPHSAECTREWKEARDFCSELMNNPGRAPNIWGGSFDKCVRGQVSQRCGGNRVQ